MAGLHYLKFKRKMMKKVMFLVVGMLFAANVNAASLTLTDVDSKFTNDGGSIINNSSDAVHVNSGTLDKAFVHTFDVTNTGSTGMFRLWVDGTASSTSFINSFSVLVDGIEIAVLTAPSYTVGVFNSILLSAGQTVQMIVAGDFEYASYGLTLQTPIPAALFLFAPALLGFFGLRRKAAVAA